MTTSAPMKERPGGPDLPGLDAGCDARFVRENM
jgi:hypothetical protein